MNLARIPRELEGVLACTPDTLSGAVRFAGTRVPVQALLDCLLFGRGLDEFLLGCPDVDKEQAEAVVKWHNNQARSLLGLDLVS